MAFQRLLFTTKRHTVTRNCFRIEWFRICHCIQLYYFFNSASDVSDLSWLSQPTSRNGFLRQYDGHCFILRKTKLKVRQLAETGGGPKSNYLIRTRLFCSLCILYVLMSKQVGWAPQWWYLVDTNVFSHHPSKFDTDSPTVLWHGSSWWRSPEILSLPRAGVLCAPHHRRHKNTYPLMVFIFSQSLRVLCCSVWPAGMWDSY